MKKQPIPKGLSVIKQNPGKQDTSFDQSIDRTESLQLGSLSNPQQFNISNNQSSQSIQYQMKKSSANEPEQSEHIGKVLLSDSYITDLKIIQEEVQASKQVVLSNMRKKGYFQQKIDHINTVLSKANKEIWVRFINNAKFIPDKQFTQQEKVPTLVQLKLDKSVYKMNENRRDILARGIQRYENETFKPNSLNVKPTQQPKQLMINTNHNGYVLESEYISNIPLNLLQKQEQILKNLQLQVIEKTKRLNQIKNFRNENISTMNKKCKLNRKWEGQIKYIGRE